MALTIEDKRLKRAAYMREYRKSGKGRSYHLAYMKKYHQTDKYKNYLETDEYKESRKLNSIEYHKTDNFKQYMKNYRKTDQWKEYMRLYSIEYRKNHPERMKIYQQSARIKPEKNCSNCGNTGQMHKHHPDYSQPMLVITLCVDCHHKIHGKESFYGTK